MVMKIKKILSRIRQALDPVAYVKDSIIAKQAVEIDRLQMQCDWLEQLAIVEGENLRKIVTTMQNTIDQLDWELNTSNIDDTDLEYILKMLDGITKDKTIERDEITGYFQRDLWDYINYEKCRNGDLQPNDVY